MNAYTPQGQARIRQRDIASILRTDVYLAGPSLEALERQRGGQVEAELNWVLKQHGVTRKSAASLVSALQQAIGAALIRARHRLAGAPRTGVSAERVAAGTFDVTPARS